MGRKPPQERKRIGILKQPFPANKRDTVYKIMNHPTRKSGIFIYFFTDPAAGHGSFDSHTIETGDEIIRDWRDEVAEWTDVL